MTHRTLHAGTGNRTSKKQKRKEANLQQVKRRKDIWPPPNLELIQYVALPYQEASDICSFAAQHTLEKI